MNEQDKKKLPTAFHDLRQENFPFTINVMSKENELLWRETVEGPCALRVPGFEGRVGYVEIEYPQGKVRSDED